MPGKGDRQLEIGSLEGDLARISGRALTMDQWISLLRDGARLKGVDRDAAKKRWKAWMAACAKGDHSRFARRLESLGLTEPEALLILGAEPPMGRFEQRWLPTLRRVLIRLTQRTNCSTSLSTTPASTQHLPFVHVLEPFLQQAEEDLRRNIPDAGRLRLADEAINDVVTDLARDLSEQVAPVFFQEMNKWRLSRDLPLGSVEGHPSDRPPHERYEAFVSEMLSGHLYDVMLNFPVLAKTVCVLMDSWREATSTMIQRLCEDREVLEAELLAPASTRVLRRVSSTSADKHDGGQRVSILTLQHGVVVVYKPRSVAGEAFFQHVVEFLNSRSAYRLKSPKVLDRGAYGWMEFIEQRPSQDLSAASRYFFRTGMLLCLAHIFSISDLNAHNVIAHGEYPCLIDLETAFQLAKQDMTGDLLAGRVCGHGCDSILSTGLLPIWSTGVVEDCYNSLSGLGGSLTGDPRIQGWLDANTDMMRPGPASLSEVASKNVLYVGSEVAFVEDFHDEISAGFTVMSSILGGVASEMAAPGGLLDEVRGRRFRVILRPTMEYEQVSRLLIDPVLMRDGRDRSIAIELLGNRYLSASTAPAVLPRLNEEVRSLDSCDIPRFEHYIGECVDCAEDQSVAIPAHRPSLRRGVEGVFRSNSTWTVDADLMLIEQSLAVSSELRSLQRRKAPVRCLPPQPRRTLNIARSMCFDAAVQIFRALQGQIGSAGRGAPIFGPRAIRGGFAFVPTGVGLYSGALGVAVLGAAFEKVCGIGFGDDFNHQVLDAVKSVPRPPVADLRSADRSGYASLIYGSALIGRFTGSSEWLEAAVDLLHGLISQDLEGAIDLDVTSGIAGVALSLAAVAEVSTKAEHVSSARMLSDMILEKVDRWPVLTQARSNPVSAGFAHGIVGVCFALFRLGQAAGDEASFGKIHALLTRCFSSRSTNSAGGGYRAMLSAGEFGWCRGVAGLGLALVHGLERFECDGLPSVPDLVQTVLEAQPSRSDSLCCGNVGRVAFLRSVAEIRHADDIAARAANLSLALSSRDWQLLPYGGDQKSYGILNPGLFFGVSGIAFELLAIARPGTLPAVPTMTTGVFMER